MAPSGEQARTLPLPAPVPVPPVPMPAVGIGAEDVEMTEEVIATEKVGTTEAEAIGGVTTTDLIPLAAPLPLPFPLPLPASKVGTPSALAQVPSLSGAGCSSTCPNLRGRGVLVGDAELAGAATVLDAAGELDELVGAGGEFGHGDDVVEALAGEGLRRAEGVDLDELDVGKGNSGDMIILQSLEQKHLKAETPPGTSPPSPMLS